jgi:hypothetical protein
MKVNMGKYTTWVGPYQLADLLQKVGVSEDQCHHIGEYLSNTKVNDLCEWVESKKKRKVKVRIDYFDTWSMDETLAPIILPMLKQLKGTKHGSPIVDLEDVPDYLRPSWDYRPHETDPFYHYRWTWIMNEMIFAFESLTNDWEEQFNLVHGEWHSEELVDNKAGHSILVWDVKPVTDYEGRKAYQDRISNGFRLFGKYFQALWD